MLNRAAGKGAVVVVKRMLARGISDTSKNRALAVAASKGRVGVIKALLDAGAGIDSNSTYGKTPLMLAIINGNLASAGVLIELGATQDVFTAAGGGRLSHLERLLKTDSTLAMSIDAQHGLQPIHWAARNGQAAIIEFLQSKGVDISIPAVRGRRWTPLHFAIDSNHLRAAKWLIDHGANVNAASSDGRGPLHLAARRRCVPIASALLRCGADINAVTKEGNTPMHMIRVFRKWGPMGNFLLEKGADLTIKNKKGKTPKPEQGQP
jgi:ankyrin